MYLSYGLCPSFQVFNRLCTIKECGGKLLLDGNSKCLLKMKSFPVTYEVLRAFTFHFLLGRYSVHYSITCMAIFIGHNSLLQTPLPSPST